MRILQTLSGGRFMASVRGFQWLNASEKKGSFLGRLAFFATFMLFFVQIVWR